MSYGQYSAGSCRRTKADLVAHFGAEFDIATAKLGGHNRLDFTTASGARVFTLHLTAVAVLSPEGDRLTLADGGWPTPTTRSAWGDALGAFGVAWFSDMPKKTERSVTYTLERVPAVHGCWRPWERNEGREWLRVTGRADAAPDLPMIRASVDQGEGNFAVRFDGEAGEIVSEAGVRVPCTPFKALVNLYRIDALARATRGYVTMRGRALDQFSFEAFGYTICPGQTSRLTMIGCHTFKTREIRATLAELAGLYPEQARKAKRFVKANPTDFGVATYEAERAARYASRAA